MGLRRVVRVRCEWGDLVGTPNVQRHGGEDALELRSVVGRKEPERAPLTRLDRRPPEAQEVSLGREHTRPRRLECADAVDLLLRRSRNLGSSFWLPLAILSSAVLALLISLPVAMAS